MSVLGAYVFFSSHPTVVYVTVVYVDHSHIHTLHRHPLCRPYRILHSQIGFEGLNMPRTGGDIKCPICFEPLFNSLDDLDEALPAVVTECGESFLHIDHYDRGHVLTADRTRVP